MTRPRRWKRWSRRSSRNSGFPTPMRTGNGRINMSDSDPTHDNPRNTRNLPAVVPSGEVGDRKSTRLNSSHGYISYAVFCLKKKKKSQGNGELAKKQNKSEVR